MAPFGLLSYGQNVIDEINTQILVEEYIAKNGGPPGSTASTASPPIVIADDTNLSVNTQNVHEETTIDQSNHGVSFTNMHWASISTGLSSILAVVVVIFIVTGCCYFQGRRQRQSRARHVEVLRNIVSSAGHHSSTPAKVQSGAYPGPSSSDVIRTDPSPLPLSNFPPLPPPAGSLDVQQSMATSPRLSTSISLQLPRLPSLTTPARTQGPLSSSTRADQRASIPSPASASCPVQSIKDYNLAGVKAHHLRIVRELGGGVMVCLRPHSSLFVHVRYVCMLCMLSLKI